MYFCHSPDEIFMFYLILCNVEVDVYIPQEKVIVAYTFIIEPLILSRPLWFCKVLWLLFSVLAFIFYQEE